MSLASPNLCLRPEIEMGMKHAVPGPYNVPALIEVGSCWRRQRGEVPAPAANGQLHKEREKQHTPAGWWRSQPGWGGREEMHGPCGAAPMALNDRHEVIVPISSLEST